MNHGIVTVMDNDNNSSGESPNKKATQAYKLFSEGGKPVEVAIQTKPVRKGSNGILYRILETKAPIQFI